MSAVFTLRTQSGLHVTGRIQGAGGMVSSAAQVQLAIARANLCRPARAVYEPHPGECLIFSAWCASNNGPAVRVPLTGATLVQS